MESNPELSQFQKKARQVINLGLRSKAAVVSRLLGDIEHYKELGYTQVQILDALIESGLGDTSIGTFQSILARQRKKLSSSQ